MMNFVNRHVPLVIGWISIVIFLIQCSSSSSGVEKYIQVNDTLSLDATALFEEDFSNGLSNWVVEQEVEGGVKLMDEKMDIDAEAGSTTWFKKKLKAPLMIEYEAIVVQAGGPNDRVSDLNCFWLAQDPHNPDDFFKDTDQRKGIFHKYDALALYYVGLGGHNNTKTRFRRYDGTGQKPLLPEHDLSAKEVLIEANQLNRIRIIVFEGIVQYYKNDQLIYNFLDKNPYDSGYFGIRTTRNHLTVDNFVVYSLKERRQN